MQSSRLRFLAYLVAAFPIAVLLPVETEHLFFALMAVVFCLYGLVKAVAIGLAYRRVRPVMDTHGWVSGGGRREAREFVRTLDPEADVLTLELISDLDRHILALAASEYWGSPDMAPCRDRLDPTQVLARAVFELRHGTSLERIAHHCTQADSLGVIAEAVAEIDMLRRSDPLRTVALGLPKPASAGAGMGLDVEPVLAWAQAAVTLIGDWQQSETMTRILGRPYIA